jgi:hypothetical protein
MIHDAPGKEIDINVAAKNLETKNRRMYDMIHPLLGSKMIKKIRKRTIAWNKKYPQPRTPKKAP